MRKFKGISTVFAVAVVLVIAITIAPTVVSANQGISVVIDKTRAVNFEGQPPTIVSGRTLVPVRGVFEALGFLVTWDPDNNQALLTRHDFNVAITINSSTFTTNGATHTLDVSAQIIEGRTLVPLRAILESIGYELGWDGASQTVSVYTREFLDYQEYLRIQALLRIVLINGVETMMGYDNVHRQFIVADGEYAGVHPNLNTVFAGYFYYLKDERVNAATFRGHLIDNTVDVVEVRSPRFNAILHRNTEGSYANITFAQMLLIGYTAEEASQIFEYTIFYLTNQERVAHGLAPFLWNDAVSRAARTHSLDMAVNNTLSHTGTDGSDVATRLRREGLSGLSGWGENVYSSWPGATPARHVNGWMNSPGHRANILHQSLTHIGVGSCFVEGDTAWRGTHTQKFARGQIGSQQPHMPAQIEPVQPIANPID